MMIRLLIALAAVLAAAGVVYAGVDVYLDAPGAYTTGCAGGVVGVDVQGPGELTAACWGGDAEHVICGGLIAWAPNGDQVLVTCAEPK